MRYLSKLTITVLYYCLCGIHNNASAFTVKDFRLNAFDASAVTHRRETDEGEDAALVKISLPLPNIEANGNTVGSTEQKNGVYWVYLDPGSISLTLTDANGKDTEVRFADYGITSLGKSCTYILDCQLSDDEQKKVYDKNKRTERTEFKTPKNLSVAYKIKGEQFYMTHDEWLQQPYSFYFNIDIQGLVIEFGGKKFIYSRREVKDKDGLPVSMTWEDAQEYLKSHPDERMLTKAEAEYLVSISKEFDIANEAGLEGGAPYFTNGLPETWLADNLTETEGWVIINYMTGAFKFDKTNKMTLHTVTDIKL